MEKKQGEVFKDGNVTLKVETGCNCAPCFYNTTKHCTRIRSIVGPCSSTSRDDKTEVIFKKINTKIMETTRNVILIAGIPEKKLQTVKFVKETLNLGLKEAKDLVDNIPSVIAKKVTDRTAADLIKIFTKEGMKVEVRDSYSDVVLYPAKPNQKVETIEAVAEVPEGQEVANIETPHYWIMGTPGRGNDVYNALSDKDPFMQSKSSTCNDTIEDPSLLLWINDDHKLSGFSTKNNLSLINLIKNNWIELKLPWKPKDRDFVWAWDENDNCRRALLFYDAKNNCCFSYNGKSDGPRYDHYAPFEGEWPQWAKDALVYLED